MTRMKPRYDGKFLNSVTRCAMTKSIDHSSKNDRDVGVLRAEPVLDKTSARVEAAMRTGEEHFRELAETVEDVFWVTNPSKSRVFYVSPAYERIWGRSCRSLYDQPGSWLDAVHPEDRERVRHASASQSDGSYDISYRILRPDMQIRWIRDKAFPVRNQFGQVERLVGSARDITEYLQMQEQLRHSQKMEAVGQLAGGVAHDFNNILAAIILQADLAVTAENLPKETREGLRQISLASQRAANLVRQLLLFSRKQTMQSRHLDLNDVVRNLAKMLQCVISDKVELQLHLHPSPLITRADPVMLDQVLINLAVNARDAMPRGGRLRIQTGEKIIGDGQTRLHPEAAPGRHVCLTVSDTGTGIPTEVLPHVFEPFFTTKEPGKGTGLGLATVFGIVKQHGGFIEVSTEVEKGTCFRIFLPASHAAAESLPNPEPPKPRGGTETILLVEDDESVRLTLRAVLKLHSYRVLEASDGAAALKLWADHRETVDLLLTDLVMPGGLSGQELAGRLQQDNTYLKVLFMSGYSSEIAGRQIEDQLGENYLQKPFSPGQLLEAIRKIFQDTGETI